ncbi:hypothetical protein FQN49_000181 [Arthroderma sp. PD_2]|nr:hypothetical protein FQN49_000181 [Arthroderma sp. PD_2]
MARKKYPYSSLPLPLWLAHKGPSLAPDVADAIKEGSILVNRFSKPPFEKLISHPLRKSKAISGFSALVLVVVDAVGEHNREGDAAGVIRTPPRSTEMMLIHLSFSVTSRPESYIRRIFYNGLASRT